MRTLTPHITPLADRMRPRTFDEFVGQQAVVGKGKILRELVERDQLSSLIFWGPPGVGKTTLAHIIANQTHARFFQLSAVNSGKKDLQQIIVTATHLLQATNQRTILFIDEIHRWNKAQQDALLPHVEKGTVTLVGATTENPSFEIIGALLSRSRVLVLTQLSNTDIVQIIQQALHDRERGLGQQNIAIEADIVNLLAALAGGDARVALTTLELAVRLKTDPATQETRAAVISVDDVKEAMQKTHLIFDKKGEEFYNLISALHKSMRGSDVNASLYWLARMLEGGCDPLYIARRVLRFACEDIGMANSEALIQANAVYDACHNIGMPECSVHLAQAVVYCAKSKKSNVLYRAYKEAAIDARRTSHIGVPLHIRNAPTQLMKELGYGEGYLYNPDHDGHVEQTYLPKELEGREYLASAKTRWHAYHNAPKKKHSPRA